jgi:O-antigen/teichoic acid export membrane protein
MTLILLAAVSLGLAVLSPWFIRLIFGADFSASPSMFVLLLPGLLALALKRLLESYLYGCNKQQLAILSYLVTAAVLSLALPPLAEAYGGMGLAAATSLGNLAALLVNFWVVRRVDNISVPDLWQIRRADLLYLLKIRGDCFREH